MKILKYISLLSTFFYFEIGFSQTNRHTKENIEISVSHFFNIDRNAVNGTAFTTEIAYSKNKNNFSIGSVWWIDKIKEVSPFRGGIFSYKYFVVNDNSKIINFYFNTDLIYTFEKYAIQEYKFVYNTYDIYRVDFNSNWNSVKLLAGYGFNLNLNNHIYIYNQMNLGIEFYNYHSLTKIYNAPQFKEKYSTGSIFDDTKPAAVMKLGIGFRF